MQSAFDCASFKSAGFKTAHGTSGVVQVHCVITTAAERPENSDFAGTFHTASASEYWRQMEACFQYGTGMRRSGKFFH